MLLAIDIGNTNISFGLFKKDKLIKTWWARTDKSTSANKFQRHLNNCKHVDGVVVSSVVPEITKPVSNAIKKLFKITPLFVDYKNAGIKIGYPRPWEIGADRLVDSVAAWEKYHHSCIIIDFGTGTTLDYVDSKGVYHGGPITIGIGISNNALFNATSKLPRTKIKPLTHMIPRSTGQAIQIGIYQGYIGMTDYLIRQTAKEVGGRPKIIATGGFAKLISKNTKTINIVEPHLTLEGLRIIWSKRNLG